MELVTNDVVAPNLNVGAELVWSGFAVDPNENTGLLTPNEGNVAVVTLNFDGSVVTVELLRPKVFTIGVSTEVEGWDAPNIDFTLASELLGPNLNGDAEVLVIGELNDVVVVEVPKFIPIDTFVLLPNPTDVLGFSKLVFVAVVPATLPNCCKVFVSCFDVKLPNENVALVAAIVFSEALEILADVLDTTAEGATDELIVADGGTVAEDLFKSNLNPPTFG